MMYDVYIHKAYKRDGTTTSHEQSMRKAKAQILPKYEKKWSEIKSGKLTVAVLPGLDGQDESHHHEQSEVGEEENQRGQAYPEIRDQQSFTGQILNYAFFLLFYLSHSMWISYSIVLLQ